MAKSKVGERASFSARKGFSEMSNKPLAQKILASSLIAFASMALATGCSNTGDGYKKNTSLDTSKTITLTIAGTWTSNPGIDAVIDDFHEVYPNCTVKYEYLQDYNNNLPKRVVSEDDRIDLFNTANITKDSANREFAIDYLDYKDKVDLSETLPGLVDNYKFSDADGTEHLYAIPLGCEIRGMFVNKTILKSLNIEIPKTLSALMEACKKLKENGFIPFQHNPAYFGQLLVWPYIANLTSKSRDLVASCDEKAADLFTDPMRLLYDLTANYYYDYKTVENTTKRFTDLSNESLSRNFLNIVQSGETFTKKDDIGEVPFMPATSSLISVLEKEKENYDSKIDYEFVVSPVTEEGGYVYMSPSNGMAVNKNSFHTDWALEFMNFFFKAKNNKVYAKGMHIEPVSSDAKEVISSEFSVPLKNIGTPDLVTLSTYNLYSFFASSKALVDVVKGNNPKYMKEDGTMYEFSYYFDKLKAAFATQRESLEG